MLLIVLVSFKVLGEPGKLDVLFLSPEERVSFIQKFLQPELSKNYVQNGVQAKCIPFGEKCFHPQHGLIEPGSHGLAVDMKVEKKKEKEHDFSELDADPGKLKTETLNSEFDYNLECKEKKFFDIYCGKTGKAARPGKFEIWVDTSTSMRNSDFKVGSSTCYREGFVREIRTQCPALSIYQYANSKKQVGSVKSLCINHEQNNPQRLFRWIKGSQAKHLLIVTDADEMSMEFDQLISSLGGRAVGIEDRMIGGKHLKEFIKEYVKVCQKYSK